MPAEEPNSFNPHDWTPPAPDHIAVLLPQYDVEALIGRGGMGAVYKAVQIKLKRPVAIKVLPAELAQTEQEAFVARFQREAQLLASLNHSGIVTIYDFGQMAGGSLYFVMEFVDGTDLNCLIRDKKLTPAEALKLAMQICDALQFAHDNGVIHRDIKPANVLVTRDGRAKLADFGLALRPTDAADQAPVIPLPQGMDIRLLPTQLSRYRTAWDHLPLVIDLHGE